MTCKAKLKYSTFVCLSVLLSACGGGSDSSSGGTSSGGTTPPPAVDTTAPAVTFNPVSLSVESGQTGASTLTATDAVGVTTGPTVTCSNGGSFDAAANIFTAAAVTADTESICMATASDAAGNQGSATLTVTMTAANIAPMASASSNIATVMEGQPFVLDASESFDADDDTLSYNWVQTEFVASTAVTIADATTAVQNLTAPDLTADETLTFEVTVSDGVDTASSIVSIDVEDLTAEVTVAAPSIFNGSMPLPEIYALTTNDDGGYKTHWDRDVGDDVSSVGAFSSQDYTPQGLVSGAQIDGDFQLSTGEGSEFTRQVIKSGDTLYYINLFFAPGDDIGYTFYTGLQSGAVSGPGDIITLNNDVSTLRFISIAGAPIGVNQLVSVSTNNNAGADFTVRAQILNPDGTSTDTLLAESDFITDEAAVASFSDGTFAGVWREYQTLDPDDRGDSDIYMQRANVDGTLLGGKVKLSISRNNGSPKAVTMQDGNVFVLWRGSDGTSGQIIRPDGTFATPVLFLSQSAISSSITALKTNQVLFVQGIGRVEATVFNSDGTPGSNEFLIFEPPEGSNFTENVIPVTLEDNRVILAWDFTERTDLPDGSPEFTSTAYTAGFYPVGK